MNPNSIKASYKNLVLHLRWNSADEEGAVVRHARKRPCVSSTPVYGHYAILALRSAYDSIQRILLVVLNHISELKCFFLVLFVEQRLEVIQIILFLDRCCFLVAQVKADDWICHGLEPVQLHASRSIGCQDQLIVRQVVLDFGDPVALKTLRLLIGTQNGRASPAFFVHLGQSLLKDGTELQRAGQLLSVVEAQSLVNRRSDHGVQFDRVVVQV